MSPEATSTLYSPLTKPWAPAPTTRSTAVAELAGGGEPNSDDAAGAGAEGDAVADAGEPKRAPPAGAAPKGDWEAAPPPKGDVAGGATTPNGMGLPEAIGALTTAPAAPKAFAARNGFGAAAGAGTTPNGEGTAPKAVGPANGAVTAGLLAPLA